MCTLHPYSIHGILFIFRYSTDSAHDVKTYNYRWCNAGGFFYFIGTLREPYCCRCTAAAAVDTLTSNNKLGNDKTNKTMGISRDKSKN